MTAKKHVFKIESLIGTCSCLNWECGPQAEKPEDIKDELIGRIKAAHERHLKAIESQEKAAAEKAERLKVKAQAEAKAIAEILEAQKKAKAAAKVAEAKAKKDAPVQSK